MKMTCVVNTELSEEVDTLYPVTHWSQQSAVNEVTIANVCPVTEVLPRPCVIMPQISET